MVWLTVVYIIVYFRQTRWPCFHTAYWYIVITGGVYNVYAVPRHEPCKGLCCPVWVLQQICRLPRDIQQIAVQF